MKSDTSCRKTYQDGTGNSPELYKQVCGVENIPGHTLARQLYKIYLLVIFHYS